MRYLDIALAALIGTSAISGLFVWSPQAGDSTSTAYALQVQLRDRLLAFLGQYGVVWFLRSTASEVCTAVAAGSDSAVVLSATVDSTPCGPSPGLAAVVATLTLPLAPSAVVLEAWART